MSYPVYLTESQQIKSNKIFQTLRNFHIMCPEEFEKTGIHSCGHCSGRGIPKQGDMRFCLNCGGIGYKGFKKLDGQFVCRSCNGSGCTKCDQNGVVDWIIHARGGDLYNMGEK